jgi:hypothetical protein
MDDDLIYTEPEVEAWYGAELKRLHSVNDQVAFYYVNRYDSDNGDAQKTSGEAVSNANRADALRLPKQIHTSLDPFVALPGGVNECQRLRIQLCEEYSLDFRRSLANNDRCTKPGSWDFWNFGNSKIFTNSCDGNIHCILF